MNPELLYAVLMGLVQALTEFLPVSSSAHLLVLPALFGHRHLGLFFDVALHWGTTLAVLIYFHRFWWEAGTALFSIEKWKRLGWGNVTALSPIVLGTIPAVLAGLFGQKIIEEQLRQPQLAAVCLIVFGILLVVVDRFSERRRSIQEITLLDGCWIGLAQVLALIPGVSRSGITITAGRLRRLDSASAAQFSFLLSTPAIIGAAILETWQYLRTPGGEQLTPAVVASGVLVSAVAGLLCIHFLLRYLQKGNFVIFAVYRCLLAAAIFYLLP